MLTYHIHIAGQVQGVGFRPFVYQLARQLGLYGWVNNTLDGVHIQFNASKESLANFIDHIKQKCPSRAVITKIECLEVKNEIYSDFQIIKSDCKVKGKLLLTPDFALCENCRGELKEYNDRRYNYPFITCINCGPRFSIVQKLPYDRELTTMVNFEMCHVCEKEYDDINDRRYYSQTNSCPTCGISLSLYQSETQITTSGEANTLINKAVHQLKQGKIVAVKGIGGYLLLCAANDKDAILCLRKRKQRSHKPFALMYPSIEAIEEDLFLSKQASILLASEKAPIVLLRNKPSLEDKIAIDYIAPNLSETGVMLPYSPLFELILQQFGQPLIATSANISGSPVIYKDDDAKATLSAIADYLLLNNREIVVPQDDSVVRFTKNNQQIIIRRSRGIAPAFFQQSTYLAKEKLLAMGALMKSTFSLYQQEQTYISQYLGSLESYDAQLAYQHTLQHFLQLFSLEKADIVIGDLHEAYFSTSFGKQIAENWEVPFYQVQHHQAHFAAILAENDLIHSAQKVLGVIWDGTGLGMDGNVWGGEFFSYQNYQFERVAHLEYYPSILGDKMASEPRIAALAICKGEDETLRQYFSEQEWKFYKKLLNSDQRLQSSSMGRLFDGIASLLGLIQQNTFEGEAAMLLEAAAVKYLASNDQQPLQNYLNPLEVTDCQYLFSQISKAQSKGKPTGYLAASFHYSLVKMVKEIAESLGYQKIALSGGVFQNTLLIEMLQKYLPHNTSLFFHQQLSPNDENISYGQLMCYIIEEKLRKAFLINQKLKQSCV
ncbi:MAG: carbamoyltransferase HypF [Bacteroidota bacterium]